MSADESPMRTVSSHQKDSFLEDVRSTSEMYRYKAERARHQYVGVGLCTAAFSSLVPVAAATSLPRWVVAVLGAVVVTGHGFFALTRPHERANLYERAGNTLLLEIHKYEYCSGPNRDKAWNNFVSKVLLLESGFLQQEANIDMPGGAEPPPHESLSDGSEFRLRQALAPAQP
jgi:hypothetical protein